MTDKKGERQSEKRERSNNTEPDSLPNKTTAKIHHKERQQQQRRTESYVAVLVRVLEGLYESQCLLDVAAHRQIVDRNLSHDALRINDK